MEIGKLIYQVHTVTNEGFSGVYSTTYLKEARNSIKHINNKGKSCTLVVLQCIDIQDFPVFMQQSIFPEESDGDVP